MPADREIAFGNLVKNSVRITANCEYASSGFIPTGGTDIKPAKVWIDEAETFSAS
jgi:hypothetical protein